MCKIVRNIQIELQFGFVIVLSLLFFCMINFTNPKEILDFNLVKEETKTFIKKAQEASVADGKYNVYAIKFTVEKNGHCMTFGYISGPIHVPDLKDFKYYFYSDNELVVVSYPPLIKQKYVFINNCIQPLKDRSLITEKISPEPFFGIHCAYLYSYTKKEVKKNFYESDEDVPRNKAIFKYDPDQGTLIEMDSTSIKKTLNGEK